MLKRLTLFVGLLILLAVPRPAHAVPGMCTINGTVYGLTGAPLANGSIVLRTVFTQTFSNDTVAATPEYVALDGSGNLPAGVKVPLGSRIIITVQGDPNAHPVTVTTNPANCPISFGALLGAASGIVVPSTVVTSITTTNNVTGLTLTAQNPVAAGPANLTLSTGTVTSWTPTLTGSGSNPTVTYTVQMGELAQLGNFYWWDIYIAWSAYSGGTGVLMIGGFPVTQSGTANFYVGGNSWNWGGVTLDAGYTNLGCQVNPGTNTINVGESGSGQVPSNVSITAPGATGQILCQGWGSL